MRYRILGTSGLVVSQMGLGTNTFGGANDRVWKQLGGLGQTAVNALIGRALEKGVNLIDTADIYARGESELAIGRALRELRIRRDDVVLATKTGARSGSGPNDGGLSREHIVESIEGSLSRLGVDHIDIYMAHFPDPVTPIERSLRAFDDLVRAGKVRYIACSNFYAWQVATALGVSARAGLARFAAVEAHYSVGTREIERELVPLIRHENLGLLTWAPLANGLLTGKHGRDGSGPPDTRIAPGRFTREERPEERKRIFDAVDAMRPIAKRHGVPIARIALAWLLHQPWVTSVIFGCTRLEQLDENLEAVNVSLTPEDLATLGEAASVPIEYPEWLVGPHSAERLRLAGRSA